MLNNTRNFNPTKKVSFCLPDTNSLGYIAQQRNDMSFRIYAQMNECVRNGYKLYFFTLTYNPQHRPYFQYNGKKCPCFSREHVKYFLRGIQKELKRIYNVDNIHYIVASEYGKSREFAPHYHGVIMIPSIFEKDGVKGLVRPHLVHKLILKWWTTSDGWKNGAYHRTPLGFVLPRVWFGGTDAHGHFHNKLEIDSTPDNILRSSLYVSKYCCKQIGFYENKDVKDVYKDVKNSKNKSVVKKFNMCKPFIKTSLGFGSSIEQLVLNQEDPFYTLYYGIKTPLKSVGLSSIPSYNKRRLLYSNVLYEVQEVDVPCVNYLGRLNETLFDDFIDSPFEDFEMLQHKKYIYKRELTDFGRRYLPYEFTKKVYEYAKLIQKFRFDVTTNTFKDFMRVGEADNDSRYTNFVARLLALDPFALACYKYSYKDKVNPLHFYHWLENPYTDSPSIATIPRGKVELYWRYDNSKKPFRSEKIDSLVETDISEIYGKLSFADYCLIENKSVDMLPIFYGDEDLQQMMKHAKEYYMLAYAFDDSPLNEDFVPEKMPKTLFFNHFVCFSGFDDVILWCDSYYNFLRE